MTIAKAVAQRLVKRASDWLMLCVVLPLIILIARLWLAGLSDAHRDLLSCGISTLVATIAAKAVFERVSFHRTDGSIAHYAQRPRAWIFYSTPMLLAAVFLGFLVLAAIGIFDFQNAVFGALVGIPTGLAIPYLGGRVRRWWRVILPAKGLGLLHNFSMPMTGAFVSGAVGIICAALPEQNYVDAIAVGVYGLFVTLLAGRVDAATVRYLTLVGHSSAALIRLSLPNQFALLLPLAAVLLVTQSWGALGVSALFALGLPILTALRIFAYRVFARRIADWVVAGIVWALGYAALTFAPLGLGVIAGAFAWLIWRGSQRRWLIL